MYIDPGIWKDWRWYPRLVLCFIGPGLIVAAAVWAILTALDTGALWPWGVAVAAGIVLYDIFTERFATGRQHLEIDRLRAKIEEYDIIVEAQEEERIIEED